MSSKSRSLTADPTSDRLTNLVGAWSLGVADLVTSAAAAAAGRGGQAPAALVALHEFADGSTIDHLRRVLGISHSAAVRLIDGLDADGLVRRAVNADDRRSVALTLTPRGRRTAQRVLNARHEAVHSTLEGLSEQEQRSLIRLAEVLSAQLVDLKLDERAQRGAPVSGWLCRLCDFDACGRPEGRCPAAARAHALTDPTRTR
ncbi:MAG TPA: MarR family transcriptional regulator [Solirubrobacteraceae bacterium]|nr:MarR family transcriptional regulator [Solirubrobacteraceae bacterium]